MFWRDARRRPDQAGRRPSTRWNRLPTGDASRPGHGFAHIEEGPSAVRALAFEGSKFSLKLPGARRPLKIAEHFPRINDGRAHKAHIGALTYITQLNVPALANLG